MKPGMRVYGTIVSRTLNNIVAYANQIYDEDKELFQSDINSGLQTDIAVIKSNAAQLNEKITQEINDRLSGDTVLLNAIDLLNANSSTQGSVQYWIKQAIDAVVADAPEAFDTLKEIADWIAQDEHGIAALINRVAANERAIAAINRAISELETTLSQTDERLSDAISTANSKIDQLMLDVESDVQELHLFETEIRNEVEQDILNAVNDAKAREQEIWTDVSRVDGRVTTVSNKVTEVDNTVKGITDANGNIKYTEALQSVIDTGISNNTAFNNISSRWAVLDENQQVLEWMAAGFKSQVSPSTSFASVYAAGNNATSDAISALTTTVNANEAKLNALVTWSGNTPTGYKYTSGLVTEANKDSAIASLFAQGTSSTSKTNVMAMITAEVQGEVSSLTLTADKIYLNANETLANTIRATQGTIGGFTIGSDSISYGDYVSGRFSINADETNGPELSITRSAGVEEVHGAVLNESGLKFYTNYRRLQQYIETNKINLDGSGFLASGSLSWDNEGNLTIGNEGSVTFSGTDLKILYDGAAISLNRGNGVRLYTDYMQSDPTNYYEIVGASGGSTKALYIRPSYQLAANDAYETDINLGGPDADIHLNITGDVNVLGNSVGILEGTNSVSMYFDRYNSNKFTIKTSAFENNQWTTPNVVFKEGVVANSFVKQGGTSSQFLKADGSVTTLKTINGNSLEGSGDIVISGGGGGNYLPLTGGTLTGALTVNGNFTVGSSTEFHYVLFHSSVNVSGPLSAESIELGPGTDTASFSIINHEVRVNKGLNIDNPVKALSFIKEGGTASQFLKADGSVDSNTYITASALTGYATQSWVTSQLAGYLPLTGGTISGSITVNEGISTLSLNAHTISASSIYIAGSGVATQSWVQQQGYASSSALSSYLPLTGGTISGNLTINGNNGINFGTDDDVYIKREYSRLLIINEAGNDIIIGDYDNRKFTSIVNDLQGGTTDSTYRSVTQEWLIRHAGDAYFKSVSQTSDLRKKTIIGDVPMNIYNVANAPLFKFTWKDEKKYSGQHVGSAAQYWQTVLPELVSIGRDADMTLAMQYDVIALASAITVAKTVVDHEARIRQLEEKMK